MHILYFHQHYTNRHGSGGTRSYEFAKYLVAQGHQVTMVCGCYSGGNTGLTGEYHRQMRSGVVEGIHIIEFQLLYANKDNFIKRSIIFLRYALKSIKIALTHSYDIVFATSTPLTASIPGIFAKWLRRKPFVFEVRDLWPALPKAMQVIRNPLILSLMSALEWCSYHMADHCIGLAPGIVHGIQRRNVSANKITMIPNGCDEYFATLLSQPREIIEKTSFTAIFAGTHGIANGLDALILVAKELKKRGNNDIKLLLVGDGKMKASLMQQAKNEKLDNCIFFPMVPKHELVQLYQQADVGLMILKNVPAFYYGTSPNKFFDYLAAGLPVICNYPGWLAELITQHNCGSVVQPNDPASFADILIKLAKDRSQLAIMGKNAYQLGMQSFHRQQLAKQFSEVLTTVTGKTYVSDNHKTLV